MQLLMLIAMASIKTTLTYMSLLPIKGDLPILLTGIIISYKLSI